MAGQGMVQAVATTAAAGGTCSARVGDVVVTVRVAVGLAVAIGDTILVTRKGSHWFAIARLFTGTAEQANDGAPPPQPAQVAGRLTVAPVSTGTYRGGWRSDVTGDTLQGQALGVPGDNVGAAFYGTTPQSLTGATVTAAHVKLRRLAAAGGPVDPQAFTLWLVTQTTQPAGAPTLTSSTPGLALPVGATLDFVIPTAWAASMAAGTAGGLALFDADGVPFLRYAGRQTYPPAWTLTIDWTRP